jgi:site-specific recombinase XerD
MDFQRLVHDYVVWHEMSGHSPKTIAWYRWVLGAFHRWLEATGRSTNVADPTLAEVQAFLHAEAQRDTLYPIRTAHRSCRCS